MTPCCLTKRSAVALALSLLVALPAMGQPAAQPDILRESVGQHLADLSKLELKPFDSQLWSTLDSWTNSQPLDTSATDGKVVLIVTWASWNPASTRILTRLEQLSKKYADQGLIVVGVHHPQGFENAAKTLKRKHITFPIAHDVDGRFRKALLVDQDPDIYLIDRAGQLRYADIRTESMQAAITQLLAEDAASASSIHSRQMQAQAQRQQKQLQPKLVKARGNLPEIPFTPPPAALYQLADWPVQKTDKNTSRNQDSGPIGVPFPGSGWISDTPPSAAGRAVVYYTWRLDDPASADLVERMDRLARQLGRDVVVVGVLTGVGTQNNNSRYNDDQVDPAELLHRARRFQTSHGITHPILIDPGGSVMTVRNNTNNNKSGSVAMVVSSDSVLRWAGLATDPGFKAALSRVIDIDPGIQARRAAEDAYIKAGGG